MGRASGYISGCFAAASRFAIETPQQLDWTSCSDPAYPLPPSGDDLMEPHKRVNFRMALLQMPCRHCKTCRSPLHADDSHAEHVSCLGKSQRGWLLSLREFQCHLSVVADSFLFRERHRPGTCEERNSSAEDSSGWWQASPRWLNSRMPRHHRRESIRQSSSLSLISVPPWLWATWSCSVGVTARWMAAFPWRLRSRSYWALWLTPPFYNHLLHATPDSGAHPYHDKGCQWAQARVVSAWGTISQQAGWVVSPGAPSSPPPTCHQSPRPSGGCCPAW